MVTPDRRASSARRRPKGEPRRGGPPTSLVPTSLALPPGLAGDAPSQAYLERVWWSLPEHQRRFLLARSRSGSDSEVAVAQGYDHNVASQWRRDPVFLVAYNIIRDAPLQFARVYLNSLAPKVVATLEEGMEGGGPHHMKDRLKAAELALRASGMMVSSINVTQRSISYEEKLIRLRLEEGLEVPEHLLQEFMKNEEQEGQDEGLG